MSAPMLRTTVRRLVALLAALALTGGLAACGDDDSSGDAAPAGDDVTADDAADGGDESSAGGDTADESGGDGAASDGEETATATLGDRTFQFTGSGGMSCFITEDGGSQGGISLSDFTSPDGDELTLDWAGDSPDSSIASIDTADGDSFEANSIVGEPFEVSISGSSATVTATFNSFTDPDFGPVEGTIEVSC